MIFLIIVTRRAALTVNTLMHIQTVQPKHFPPYTLLEPSGHSVYNMKLILVKSWTSWFNLNTIL